MWRTVFASNDFAGTKGLFEITFPKNAVQASSTEELASFLNAIRDVKQGTYDASRFEAERRAYEALLEAQHEATPFHAYLGGWNQELVVKLTEELMDQYARLFTFYSCFISYATPDVEFAERLHTDLTHAGISCWFAPHDVQAGEKIHEQIENAIHHNDRLLLILSKHSMNSAWVSTEIAYARKKELQQKRKVLFPISLVPFSELKAWECFDADTGKDSAREVREYFVPDFSDWKDSDSYGKALHRLVQDLRRAESTPSS